MKSTLRLLFVCCVSAALCTSAAAQVVVASLDGTTLPINPENTFAGFSFLDHDPPGAISDGTKLTFHVIDQDGVNGIFGGTGVDFVAADPNDLQTPKAWIVGPATWEFRVKLLPGNLATAMRTTLIDVDGPEETAGATAGAFASADEYVYEWDLTSVPNDGQFHTLTKSVHDELFFATAFGAGPGDGILNSGLKQLQIQSVFGSTGEVHVEIEFARIVSVPEPATMTLGGLALASLLMSARRRK